MAEQQKQEWSQFLLNHFLNLVVLLIAGYFTASQLGPEQRGTINNNFNKMEKEKTNLAAQQKCIYYLLGKQKWNKKYEKFIKQMLNKIDFRKPDFHKMERVQNQQIIQKGGRRLASAQTKDPRDDTCFKLLESYQLPEEVEPLNFKKEQK